MASAIFNPPYSSTSSSSSSSSPTISKKTPSFASKISCSKTLTIHPLNWVPHLGLTPFSNWNGLRKHGLSISLQSLRLDKSKKCKGKVGVFASLFGVGAPEALVIGVVALLVFGPKGLAEVAKNLGKTLRAFQPTIRELQEVSREFKSTLEKEIGLDELKKPAQENYSSNTVTSPPRQQVTADNLENSQPAVPPSTTTTDASQATTTPTAEDPQATTPAVTSEDSQETTTISADTVEGSQPIDDTSNTSPTPRFYSNEDLLKITEEQLKALNSQQQKEQPSSSTSSKNHESDV
ncbi:sec-independent protein translocase protein TATB, chloroplastic-like [Rutidosis leptorrhynchoides]|uniref:sec-independent protein translocase protein TATB, chloroplastic-like n=1 Tax=Rutidosis leptorrhynchoides TaxID=125765 RepID=UPI003A99C819